jgi:hypothetical protein
MFPRPLIARIFYFIIVSIAIQLPSTNRPVNARSLDDPPLLPVAVRFGVRDFQPLVTNTGPMNWIARNPRNDREVFASSITGGLWKSTDGGSNWLPVRTLRPWSVSAVAYLFDGTPGGAILVTTREDFRLSSGAGVWRSSDRGETWFQVAQVPTAPDCPDFPRAHGIVVHGRSVYVATSCGILQSLDGRRFGEVGSPAFHELLSGPSAKFFYSVEVTQSGNVLFGGQAGLFFQFRPAVAPPGSLMSGTNGELRRAFAVTPSRTHPNFVLAVTGVGMLISNDDGHTWTRVESISGRPSGSGGSPFVRILPSHASQKDMFVYYGDSLGLYRAGPFAAGDLSELITNPSYTWTSVPIDHLDPHDIDFFFPAATSPAADSLKILLATDGGLETCGLSTATAPPACPGGTIGTATGLSPIQVMKVNGQIVGVGESAVRRLYFDTWHDDKWVWTGDRLPWRRVPGEGATLDLERRVPTTADVQIIADYYVYHHNFYDDLMNNEIGFVDTPEVASPPVMVEKGVFLEINATGTETALYATPNLTRGSITSPAWFRIANLETCGPGGCTPLSQHDMPIFAGYEESGKTNAVVYQPHEGGLAMISGFVDRSVGARRLRPVSVYYPSMKWRVPHDVLQGIGWIWPTGRSQFPVLAADPLVPSRLLLPDGRNDRVMRSNDAGENWTPVEGLSDMVIRNASAERTFIFKVVRPYGSQSMVSSISFFPENPNFVILGTVENGLFYSQDGGLGWQRIANTEHITNVVSFYWRSANSVIVGSWGRGLFEVTMRYTFSRDVMDSMCGGCVFVPAEPGFASINSPQIVPAVADLSPAQRKFDEAVLVFDGSINGVDVSQGRLRKMSVTIGSSEYRFGGRNSKLEFVAEEHTGFPGYKGLSVADRLRNRGQVVKGLAFINGRVSHVIYGSAQTPMPAPARRGPITLPKATDPHLKDPYLRIFGPGMMLGTITGQQPFNLQGFLFKPNSIVELRVDGQVGSQLRTDANGRFATRLVSPTYLGPHEIVARQSIGNRIVRAAIGFGVKNSDERRK